jgi:hypothetical protein
MESLGYVLIYFLRGSLPWQRLKAETRRQKEELILERKESTSTQELCDGLPKEFQMYFKHVRSLRFVETPDYAYLRGLFRNQFSRKGYEYDHVFDWTVLKFWSMWRAKIKDSKTFDTSLSGKVPNSAFSFKESSERGEWPQGTSWLLPRGNWWRSTLADGRFPGPRASQKQLASLGRKII